MEPPSFIGAADILFVLPEGSDLIAGPSDTRHGKGFVSRGDVITFVLLRVIECGIYNLVIEGSTALLTPQTAHLNAYQRRRIAGIPDHPLVPPPPKPTAGSAGQYDAYIEDAVRHHTGGKVVTPKDDQLALLRAWAGNIAVTYDAADPTGNDRIPWQLYVTHLMGLIDIHNAEDQRKLLVEFTQETRGGAVDEEEVSNAVQSHLADEGKKMTREERFTMSDTAGAPLVLADRTAADGIASMSVEYIDALAVWSVLQVNTASSRGRPSSAATKGNTNAANKTKNSALGTASSSSKQKFNGLSFTSATTYNAAALASCNSSWLIIEDSNDARPTVALRHVFEDHGVCICCYVEPLSQFVVFSRRQTVATFAYRNTYAPANTAGQLQQRCFVEARRPPAHLPYDVVSVTFCAASGLLLAGTLEGTVVGLPILSDSEKGWATPTFAIKHCADDAVVTLASLPKLNRIVCGSFADCIKIADTERLVAYDGIPIPPRMAGIRQVLVIEDLHLLATCGHGSEIALWALSFPTEAGGGHKSHATRRNFFVGELSDSAAPHVPPLIGIWRGNTNSNNPGGMVNPKIRNKLFSVDSIGTVKIWDLTSRSCVSTCVQPSLFRTYAAGFATINLKGTSFARVAVGARRARELRNDFFRRLKRSKATGGPLPLAPIEVDAFDTIKVRLCGVDVANHKVETREVLITLGDDYSTPQEISKSMLGGGGGTADPLLPKVSKPFITEAMRKGKHLVQTGHSLATKTISRLLTNPFHIGTFDVEAMGCIVSITNNFILLLERTTYRTISRYSGFEAAFTAACVPSSRGRYVWRYNRIAFVALEGISTILGVNLGSGEATLRLQLYHSTRHSSQHSRRDILSLIPIPARSLLVAANGEGCVGVFRLPLSDPPSGPVTDPIRPLHFIRCTDAFITRMAYHEGAEILAIGDGKGQLTQWEVTPMAFGMCSRIVQVRPGERKAAVHLHYSPGNSPLAKGAKGEAVRTNQETDEQLHTMALDETVVEITAIASLDPVRAFAVATSDAKVTMWTTVPFDRAVAVFSWEYHLPRGVNEPQYMYGKPVVTAMTVDNSSPLYIIRMVDDQGGWTAWSAGFALKESQLLASAEDHDIANITATKWAAADLFSNARPPSLLASKQLTVNRDVPLVGVQWVTLGKQADTLNCLVSVSNGDALLVGPEGEISSIIQPMIRREKSGTRSVADNLNGAQRGGAIYDCDDVEPTRPTASPPPEEPSTPLLDEEGGGGEGSAKGKGRWQMIRDQCLRRGGGGGGEGDLLLKAASRNILLEYTPSHYGAEPRLVRPTLAPPPSPTNFKSVGPRMRVQSAGTHSIRNVSHRKGGTHNALPHTSLRDDAEDPQASDGWEAQLKGALAGISDMTMEQRLEARRAPMLYPPNVALGLTSPMAFSFGGRAACVEDELALTTTLQVDRSEKALGVGAGRDTSRVTDADFIQQALADAAHVANTKPILLQGGDYVLMRVTPQLALFDLGRASMPPSGSPMGTPQKDEDGSQRVAEGDTESPVFNWEHEGGGSGSDDDLSAFLSPIASFATTPKKDAALARKKPRLLRPPAPQTRQQQSSALAHLLEVSSVAYPLTPSPYMTVGGASPPCLSPFLFGVSQSPAPIMTAGGDEYLKDDERPSTGNGGKIRRNATPITEQARPSTPSIPLLTKRLGERSASSPHGTLRKPPLSAVAARNDLNRSKINYHLPSK